MLSVGQPARVVNSKAHAINAFPAAAKLFADVAAAAFCNDVH